jgi:hypothetical protein
VVVTTPQQWPPAPHQQRPPALDDATRPIPQQWRPHTAGYPAARQPYGPPLPRHAPPPPRQYAPPAAEPVIVNVTQQVTQTTNATGGPSRSITKERKRTSHGLHLFLTIVTGGAWGICVWLPLTMWHRFGPRRKVVTKHL